MNAPYRGYRDTALEWLPSLPSTWGESEVGREVWVRARLGWKGLTADEYVDEGIPMLATPDIKGPLIDYSIANKITRERYDESPEIMLENDDVLLTKDGATIGIVNVVRALPEPATVNGSIAVLTSKGDVEGRYMYWFIASSYAQALFDRLKGGMGVPHLFQRDINRVRLPLPSSAEQIAISDYLDRETAQIDTLIEAQNRLIEMLRERRQSVVEHAVFSGLDGAKMIANDEAWLPPTPRNWRVLQLGFVASTLAGWAFPSEGFTEDDQDVRLLRGINVKPGTTDWSEVVYWNEENHPVPSEYSLNAGDLVLGMDRPFVGGGVRIAAITQDDLPAFLLQRVMRIRPNAEGEARYFRYLASTGAFLAYLEPLFTGVSVPHMSEWQVRKFKMPCPSFDEQYRIAEYLDEQTATIDTLIAETVRFVDLSRERRSALITAAVTGQIDVREMVA